MFTENSVHKKLGLKIGEVEQIVPPSPSPCLCILGTIFFSMDSEFSLNLCTHALSKGKWQH